MKFTETELEAIEAALGLWEEVAETTDKEHEGDLSRRRTSKANASAHRKVSRELERLATVRLRAAGREE